LLLLRWLCLLTLLLQFLTSLLLLLHLLLLGALCLRR